MLADCPVAIDWSGTGSMLQALGTFAGVGAIIFATFHATHTWKSQKRAERRLENAERILTATYKARRALGFIRGAIVLSGELLAAEDKFKQQSGWGAQTKDRRDRLILAQAIMDRIMHSDVARHF